jgi:cytoskeleton protein RodZ
VSDLSNVPPEEAPAPYVPPTAGGELRAARVAAGLDIDVIAQQLKLAPRQVQALEDDDYAKLPGRTFVRGFVRNYARLLQLDPDDVVALLPGADVAPSLERPTITPSRRVMGELPADAPARRAWTRWAIPLALIAIIVAAGVYEFRRPQGEPRRTASEKGAPSPIATPGATTATLPNPLSAPADATPPEAASAAAPGPIAGAGTPPAAVPAPERAPASAAPVAAPAAAAEPLLVLTFKRSSWVQVKDRNGNTLLAQTSQPGTTQSVSGALPLDVVIGNAPAVTATFRGQAVDLASSTRANVARISLK